MDPRLGTEIGGYRIESLLGRGGMGEVYLATQSFPERKVALKLLPHDLASDAGFHERFIRESNAAASLEHPNIVPIYGAGESDGELWIAMRYVEGTDLRWLLEAEGSLEPERTVRIVTEVADALDAAHRRGLVHRDVKPGNVLVGNDEHAYLTDFGLIRRSEARTGITRTGEFMGSVDYVAPEQIRGESVDGRADVYSLGCLLYECLTGEPPFVRESEVATLYAHLQDPPPRPSVERPELPTSLDGVITKAMAKRPEDRYATASELATEARAAVGPTPAEPGRGRRGLVGALVAAVVLIAGLVVALVLSGGGAPAPTPESEPSLAPNQVVNLDPETREVLMHASPVPYSRARPFLPPSSIAVGEGGVWAIDDHGIAHVEPDTGEVTEIPLSGAGLDVAVGGGAVWAADSGWRLSRIDPATDRIRRDVLLPAGEFTGTQVGTHALATGDRSVWVTSSSAGTLGRIDSATDELLATIPGLGIPTDVAFGAGSAWVVDDLGGDVLRIDSGLNEVVDRIPVPGRLTRIAADDRGVWVLHGDSGTVTRIDPTTLAVVGTYRVGNDPTDIQASLGAVWVANFGDGTLSRIDPVTSDVETIDVGGPVTAVAGDEATGTLWLQLGQLT